MPDEQAVSMCPKCGQPLTCDEHGPLCMNIDCSWEHESVKRIEGTPMPPADNINVPAVTFAETKADADKRDALAKFKRRLFRKLLQVYNKNEAFVWLYKKHVDGSLRLRTPMLMLNSLDEANWRKVENAVDQMLDCVYV